VGPTLEVTLACEEVGQRHPGDANGSGGKPSVNLSVDGNRLKDKPIDAVVAVDAKLPTPGTLEKKGMHLSDGRIRELADVYLEEAVAALAETDNVDRAALEGRLRATLAAEGVAPESVDVELARIMDVLTTF
jgi:hypothetical protein